MIDRRSPDATRYLLGQASFAFLRRMVANKDIYIAASVAMSSALGLIMLQKTMLSNAEFITLSIAFASASFISVIAQLGDDSDVLEGRGASLYLKCLGFVFLRAVSISVLISVPFCFFNESIQSFGLLPFTVFTTLFAVGNWAYNLRRNQALMRHDDRDFRNTSIFCALIRLGGFAILAPVVGPYAVFSEVIARILFFPVVSRSSSGSLCISPFTLRKFVRSVSYSTDALVQTQALTAVSMIASTTTAATMIVALRLMFYGTGALSQVVGTIFNRAIFQRKPLSFVMFVFPGLTFALLLVGVLWTIHRFGGLDRDQAVGAIAVVFAFLTFPTLHPLSRLFTAVDREWIKLVLQLAYCGMVVWIAAMSNMIWAVVAVTAAFSAFYAVTFCFLAANYNSGLTDMAKERSVEY